MEEDYVILKQYLLNLEYNSQIKPEKILIPNEEESEANQANEIVLGIEFQKDSGLFYVDLTVTCDVSLTETSPVFSLKVTCRGVVAVNYSLPDDRIRECLNILVPQELYDNICDIIYSVTENSGYAPIEMDVISFKEESLNKK